MGAPGAGKSEEKSTAALVLRRECGRISSLFVSRCRLEISASRDLDGPALLDHLPRFIQEITRRLESRVSAVQSGDTARKQGREHAEYRATQDLFRLPDIINEYRILRAVIFEVLDGAMVSAPVERNLINAMIDERLLETVTRFTELARQRELAGSSDRERLNNALASEQARSDAIIRQMPAALIIGEAPSGKLIFANARIREVMGQDLIPADDIQGYMAIEGWHLDGRPIQPEEWPLARAIRNGEETNGEIVTVRRASGERRFLRLSASPVRDRAGRITAGIVICEDITGIRQTIDALSLSEDRYRTIFERAPVGIAELDDGNRVIRRANPTYCRMLGYTEDELLGKSVIDLTHPDDVETDLRTAADLKSGKIPLFQLEKRYLRKDGAFFWARVTATLIQDSDRRPERSIVIVQDINEQKRRETELRQAIRAREETLAVVSHDLRNPLSTITMLASLIGRESTGGPSAGAPHREAARRILEAASRMNRLIQDILDIARLEAGTYKHQARDCLSGELVDEVLAIMKPFALEKAVTLRARREKTSPWLSCDRDGMIRVFVNLIGNAIKFTPAGGTIELAIESSPPGQVTFRVTDNGRGIPAKDLPNIFNRFYQSDAGEMRRLGTGLGLAIVKAITEAHSGRVRVESEAGKGSTFLITLPALDRAAS